MARHAATLLEEPVTAPIPASPPRPVSGTARSSRIALWACAVAVLVAAAGVLGGVTALHLVAPGSAGTQPPALAAAPITTPAADPRPVTAATQENSVTKRSTGRSPARNDSKAVDESASSSRKGESGSRTGRHTTSGGSSSSTRSAATKRSSGARSGDGCGPYEHKLSTGWCSPDVGVTDENGNPDPSLAVVPGNLR